MTTETTPQKAALTVIEKLNGIALKRESGFMQALEQSLPQHSPILAPALVRGAVAAIRASEALQRCSEFSLFCSIAEVAQTGLSLDVHLGQAFLVPFSNIATVMYGYRGLCELARRSGEIGDIVGEIRYAKDDWLIRLGTQRELVHIPYDGPIAERGEMLGAYAVAELIGGGRRFEYMTADQIEKIKAAVLKRKRSDKPSPWETNEDEMWRKTPIRRLAKRLPQSPALLTFINAAIRDEYRQQGHTNGMQVSPQIEKVLEAEGIRPEPMQPETAATVPMPKAVHGKKAGNGKSQPPKAAVPAAATASATSGKSAPPAPAPALNGKITENQFRDLAIWCNERKLDMTVARRIAGEIGHTGSIKELPARLLKPLYARLETMG